MPVPDRILNSNSGFDYLNGKYSATEILPVLKAKYKNYLLSGIVSVRFYQTAKRCYLEVTTEKEIAGYLLDQVIERTDLAFIHLDRYRKLFRPEISLEENTKLFLDKLDSNCEVLDLFTEEGRTAIMKNVEESFRS